MAKKGESGRGERVEWMRVDEVEERQEEKMK